MQEFAAVPWSLYRRLTTYVGPGGRERCFCDMLNRVVEHRKLDRVFAAVADPTRRAILRQIGAQPARVTDIAKGFPVSLNAISKHVIVLERAGLIVREVRGREHFCRLNARPLGEAAAWLEEMRAFWEARLDALERYVSAKRRRDERK